MQVRRIVAAAAAAALCASVVGCAAPSPLIEYQHLSHVTQHFGGLPTNYGANMYGAGLRWRPARGITIDVVENYSLEKWSGGHEVFSFRLTFEPTRFPWKEIDFDVPRRPMPASMPRPTSTTEPAKR